LTITSVRLTHRNQVAEQINAAKVRAASACRRLTNLIQQTSTEIERRWEESLGPARMRDLRAALEHLDAIGPRQGAAGC
jgi:hypothetical protein